MLDLQHHIICSNRLWSLTSPPSQSLLLNGISFLNKSFAQYIFSRVYSIPEQWKSTASSIISSTVAYSTSFQSMLSPVTYCFSFSISQVFSANRLFQTLD